ncbi:Autophagy- protein 9A [Bulinus truncatus]|nr:Autophagy- protein 9A [Bulinus truncatus]
MASDSEEIEYQALGTHPTQFRPLEQHRQNEEEEDSDISLHEEQGFLVHMSPEVNKTQWNHVDDLDKFFTSVYEYHQRHGFQNMVLSEMLQLVQFIFVALFMTYLSWCVNYAELFDEIPHNSTVKKTFSDITYPLGTCVSKILRFKNYLVAMVNKDLLPLKFRVPFVGEHAILTHGMRFNLDVLLYWSPWSIFVNSYTMREEYKSSQKKKFLTDRANYGRLYLRHFNELDHELNARLNRAYIPSKMYMNSFTSPSLIILAKYVAFFAGAPAAVLFVLGILDFNDVTKVEHLFTVASICGMVATICSSLIPDENEVFCPERLMMSILAQIHYMPDHWKGRAHTSFVRDEFAMLFQYKLVYIIEELLSPLFTPFWLFFLLRPKSQQIVDFFRCFTVEVAGVGDVCSFAQMDIKKHGNPQWMKVAPVDPTAGSRTMQAENGKIELSLMHFATTNPEWKPPQESNMFINGVKLEVQKELPVLTSIIADPISLPSLGYVNPMAPILPMGSSLHLSSSHQQNSAISFSPQLSQTPKLRGGLSNLDGPLTSGNNFPSSLTASDSFQSTTYPVGVLDEGQRELLSGNMSLSVLHIHETHHRQRHSDGRSRFVVSEAPGINVSTQYMGAHSSARPQSFFPQRQQFQTYFGCSPNAPSASNISRPVIPRDDYDEPYYGQPKSRDDKLSFNLGDQVTINTPNPHSIYCEDDSYGMSDFSSLPPLAEPDLHYGSPPSITSTPSPGQHHPVLGNRLASDHMPEIKEDTVEHELDTTMS